MSRAIENYVCSSEDRLHYDYDRCGSYYPNHYVTYGSFMRKTQPVRARQELEKQVFTILTSYLKDMGLDYTQLSNKPTVNGEPLIGDLSKFLDLINIDQLETLLKEDI